MLELIERSTELNSPDVQAQREQIRLRYEQLDASAKSMRAREIAQALDISEAQWVAASCGPIKSIHLKGSGQQVFTGLSRLGPVMALTRNASCVHERHGQYLDIQAEQSVGLVLGPDIDLRAFFACWRDVFAVQEGARNSLQFFDKHGQAVHKVYCTSQTDLANYLALVQDHAQTTRWPASEPLVAKAQLDHRVDRASFRQAWLALTDTHEFFPLLRKFKVSRLGALEYAQEDLAQRVGHEAIQAVLCAAADKGLPIMCFVGNRGMIQIHTGVVKQIVSRASWLNVLDPEFNLHLNMNDVDSVWVVNKPTSDGWVTSLEVFDVHGELIVQFFGARKPGTPELADWRTLMSDLCHTPLHV